MNELRDLVDRIEAHLAEARRILAIANEGGLTTAKMRIKVTLAVDELDDLGHLLVRARVDGVLPRA